MESDDGVIAQLLESPERNPNLEEHITSLAALNRAPLTREHHPPSLQIQLALPPHCRNARDISPKLLHAENSTVFEGYFRLVDRCELTNFPWYVNVPPIPDSILPCNPIFLQEKDFTKNDRKSISLKAATIKAAIPRFFTPDEVQTIYQGKNRGDGLEINFWIITPDNQVSVGNGRLKVDRMRTCVIENWYDSQEDHTKMFLDKLLTKAKGKGVASVFECFKSRDVDVDESKRYLWFFYDASVPTFVLSTEENSSVLSDPLDPKFKDSRFIGSNI
ncbi:hypothetical protein AQUCO_07400045v1 [Aquilegia coerulea]|uniref:Uncharacterized protein n=1 Tax=Aquilegia coerulea TaxID=218851 RepID=A0A2G5C9I4_AQUCA|nr:hypothetical protein AQUCO_07400045v1 [Aquilegia coerulea]PIA27934.1 hypothetical protein AQUCO_07400045v1 [Aquilegia coerulea]PIA27935.1 hypothetical protein AQUCO_07400045v1 [Aquilegia coerulea]